MKGEVKDFYTAMFSHIYKDVIPPPPKKLEIKLEKPVNKIKWI